MNDWFSADLTPEEAVRTAEVDEDEIIRQVYELKSLYDGLAELVKNNPEAAKGNIATGAFALDKKYHPAAISVFTGALSNMIMQQDLKDMSDREKIYGTAFIAGLVFGYQIATDGK